MSDRALQALRKAVADLAGQDDALTSYSAGLNRWQANLAAYRRTTTSPRAR